MHNLLLIFHLQILCWRIHGLWKPLSDSNNLKIHLVTKMPKIHLVTKMSKTDDNQCLELYVPSPGNPVQTRAP